MKRLAVLCLILAVPVYADTPEPSLAGTPTVTVPKTKAVNVGERFSIAPKVTNGGAVKWAFPDKGSGLQEDRTFLDLLPAETQKQLLGRVFYANTAGTFRIWAYCGGPGNTASDLAECVVTVGTPVPPVPPTPPVPPVPPGPTPGPAPIPEDGLHVLIVYESSDLPKYPKDQQAVLYGADVRSYLNSHCVKAANGKAGWRVWDQNTPTGADEKIWQDAMARKRDKLPWLIVSNGKAGYEGPLPANVADTMKLLTTYGGN